MKRPSLSLLIFLAVLLTATVVALGMGLAARLSFSHGFMGYLNAQAVGQIELALPRLQRAWAEHGDWEFLRHRQGVWFRMTEPAPDREGHSPWEADPAALAPQLLGAARRLSLLDAERRLVIGYPHFYADSVERPIVVDGRNVGWIVLAPIETVTDAASLRFQRDQWHASLAAGAVSLLLAAACAAWVARSLLKPLRRMAATTHLLAAGHYDSRVDEAGPREVHGLAADFNRLARTLECNEALRRAYMADVSHELRTPLAVLRGEIEAMQDGIHHADAQGLQLLHGEVQRLGRLVNDLHELALADVGALRYRLQPVDVTPLLCDVTDGMRARCAEHGLTLSIQWPDAPAMVMADPDRLAQLLGNLLDNALRYTDAGGRIELTLRLERDGVRLTVDDSAPGVAEELRPRLFERFFRVEASRSRRSGGSGLGLAICRSIADAHGGRLQADASPLGGLRISLWLPPAPTVE